MDELIDKVENISLSSCIICKKTIYNNDICREGFLNYLAFIDSKECVTCGSIFKPTYNDENECSACEIVYN